MRRAVIAIVDVCFVAVLALIATLSACGPDTCMESGYVRSARGSADYAMSSDPRGAIDVNANRHGSLSTSAQMHRFRPFRDGKCEWQSDNSFSIELGPSCVLRAMVTNRAYDTGKHASLDFLQAEGAILGNQECTLDLDGDRSVRGTVESGNVNVLTRSLEVTVGLKVEEWSGEEASGFLKYEIEGTWLD